MTPKTPLEAYLEALLDKVIGNDIDFWIESKHQDAEQLELIDEEE